uniref:Uncharacterized protein n=1 Tax=Rhipicephalus appendiculatus TaxID=34631 RepID=A0A131YGP3_RHIAP
MTYSQKLVIHVSVAAVLALFSAVTEVKAAEFQGDYDDLKEELKVLRRKVSDLEHHCKILDMGMAEVPNELKELKAQVKALQNKGKNTESNSIPPVPGMSIGEVYKMVLEIDEKLGEMESEKRSLYEAVERMKRDIESERLERNISIEAARAEARSVTEVLAPEVKGTLVELPSMVAKMKRFDRTGRYIMQLLSPAASLNETADEDKLNSFQFEENSIAVPEEETNEPTTESDAEIHAAADDRRSDVPRHSPQQKFNISGNLQEILYSSTAPTNLSDADKNRSHGQPKFIETALFSEALKNDGYENVSEIEFVGQERNFSISITDSKITGCMEYGFNNGNISNSIAEPCDGFRADLEGHGAEERMAPVSDDFTTHRWSIENVIMVMAKELKKLRKRFDEDALNRRVEQIEKNADRMMTNMSKLERSINDGMEQGFVNTSLRSLREHNLTHLDDTTQELARNTSSLWQSLHNAQDKMQQVQRDLSEAIDNINVGNNASFHSMKENLLLSMSQLSRLNESLQRSLAESETALKGEWEKLKSEIELKMRQLTQTVQECSSAIEGLNWTAQGVLNSLRELSESHNSSIVSTEIRLQSKMDDLHQGFLIEIERLKAIVKKNAESLAQLPSLSGWHPDDAADCPGLDVLATDDRLVLSTHNSGRYRAPHLPSDPLPVGSVVRFRCVPAGSHKLNGAAEIRCLGAKRWSSKPPRCQPLLTLDQIMAGNTTDMTPSILYDNLVDDELASTDDSDNLVVRLGANLRLKCLYPRKRGNVTWLHNGTFPSDAALAWVKEGPADLGENAYMLEIKRTSPEHSGTYRCETTEGTNHSITIKILDHFSLPEGACLRPVVPEELSVSPDKDWYETGTRISYSCQGGKILVGMPNSTCHEGQWMGRSRSCR